MTDHYTRAAIPEMVEAVKPAMEAANRLFEQKLYSLIYNFCEILFIGLYNYGHCANDTVKDTVNNSNLLPKQYNFGNK